MIPVARPGSVVAVYREGIDREVQAWDDDGSALVVCDLNLKRAQSLPGFRYLEERDTPIAVVPGGKELLRVTFTEDGARSELPVVAWIVNQDGRAETIVPAVECDAAGDAYRVSDLEGEHTVDLVKGYGA